MPLPATEVVGHHPSPVAAISPLSFQAEGHSLANPSLSDLSELADGIITELAISPSLGAMGAATDNSATYDSPAPSAPWLVREALSVQVAVEEAVRGLTASSCESSSCCSPCDGSSGRKGVGASGGGGGGSGGRGAGGDGAKDKEVLRDGKSTRPRNATAFPQEVASKVIDSCVVFHAEFTVNFNRRRSIVSRKKYCRYLHMDGDQSTILLNASEGLLELRALRTLNDLVKLKR